MTHEYFALYKKGDEQPLGALRADIVDEVMSDLDARGSKPIYYKTPITLEEAKLITERITKCSEGIEKILAEK